MREPLGIMRKSIKTPPISSAHSRTVFSVEFTAVSLSN